MIVAKESPYIHALVVGIALALSGCNLETVSPVEETELKYPEVPLRTQKTSSFNIVDHSPIDGVTNQSLLREVLVTFDTSLLSQTVTPANVHLRREGRLVPATVIYVADTRTIRIMPEQPLAPDSQYQVALSDRLMAATGETYVGAEWQFATAGPIGDTNQSTLDSCMSEQSIALLEAVNRLRQSQQSCGAEALPPAPALSYQCTLGEVAQGHAEGMAGQTLLSHLSSNGLGLPERAEAADYAWRSLGENLAVTTRPDNIQRLTESWMASESHCRNIMNPAFSQMGMGQAQGPDGRFYWVQNLGAPEADNQDY